MSTDRAAARTAEISQITRRPEQIRAAWTVARAWRRHPLFLVIWAAFSCVCIALAVELLKLGAHLADLAPPSWVISGVGASSGVVLGFAATVSVFAGTFYTEARLRNRVVLWLEDETGTATVLLKPDGEWTKAVYLASHPKRGHMAARGRGRAIAEAARDRARADGRPISAYALPGLTDKYEEGGLTPVGKPKWGLGLITRLEDHSTPTG